ncbi:MAG: hypothetical protein JSV63_04090 [Candidatus Aenigmatarchaeota archaeon]|nr:MAG: hypothetical protein JSV63_04090 [Candidatus Aenigmarchaeota archaeon]
MEQLAIEKDTLESIGLTENESLVYLTLLETGSTLAGTVIKKTKMHRSTVYEILQRLIDRSLVSFVLKDGKRHFQAENPKNLVDMLKENEKKLESILPSLLAKVESAKVRQEATVHVGIKAVRGCFNTILRNLKRGEEYYVIGASTYVAKVPGQLNWFKYHHIKRAKLGIGLKILISVEYEETFKKNIGMTYDKFKFTEVKRMPGQINSPMQVVICKNTVFLVLWGDESIAIEMEGKEVAKTFMEYFNLLWDQQSVTLTGREGIMQMCEEVIRTGEDVFLIGANGWLPFVISDFFEDFEKRRVNAGITRHHLAIEETRGTPFSRLKKLKVRYLPKEFSSPMVIWILGNHVAQVLWDDKIVFMTDNKKIADDYRKYFRFLWKNAKP